jgi:hypothetical protein
MAEFQIRPSDKFKQLVTLYGGVNQIALKWDMEYRTLHRFLDDGLGISGSAVATIVERSGLPYSELFVHVKGE